MLRITEDCCQDKDSTYRKSRGAFGPREQSFEKSLDPELREFVSEAFDIFDLNNVRIAIHPLVKCINRSSS